MSEPTLPLAYRSEPPETADGPAPMVLLLHGRGADENDLLPVGRQLPGDPHLLSLRAPTDLGPGYTWYDLDLSAGGLQRSQPDQADFERSRGLVEDCYEAAVEGFDVDPERVGLLGFSQGAILSLAAVLDHPDRFAWVAALHGYLPESHADLDRFDGVAGFPAFLAAGEFDQVIPARRAREAADALREAGLDVTYGEYPASHGVGTDELDDLVAWVGERDGFGGE